MSATFRPMTAEERVAALGLERVRMAPEIRSLATSLTRQAKARATTITDKQAASLWRLCWTYRRQLPADIVRDAQSARDRGSR